MKIKVVESVLKANDAVARENRRRLDAAGVMAINLMSAPGSGKTRLLEKTIPGLGPGQRSAVLIFLAAGFILYLFLQSTLIAHIKGNGVELTEAQFPDLYAQFAACCDRLQITKRPKSTPLNTVR